ncbi:phage tail tape measure protein [Pectobacterium aroidearum]|uniref:Phage tail tape measure protein n=1 Tax=Pectobacterium aroidearum TaxID=1201031 RepID=A0ABR5Z7P7_9GAMM|nr:MULTISPECIES: phage tail tape measure protein [Pectobacterium]MBA5197747.1 phage tail tape measure protein [Pectobacterium aroidearum]MBA5230349.1 phage tail tape measure protein [Pectobacterium aroidearum]MBA5230540.1 phage tail tape measure protein [Pectobacterium aroidearum]MBA5735747.1 phage tail tape measure protein [Pectobacterium aroidearum]UXK02524.1 phage tail tape measure protein [Pectobacterium aroidearum]
MLLNGVMLGRAFGATLDDTKKSLQPLSDKLKQAEEWQRLFNQSLEHFGNVSLRSTQVTSRLSQSLSKLVTNQERLESIQSRQETLRSRRGELADDFKTKREQFGSVMKPIVASVTRYASFEAQLRGISVAHGISSEQEKLMGQKLRQSSQQVNQKPDALLGSAGQLLAYGMSPDQATDVAAVLGKTSTASGAALSDLTALSATLDDVFNLKGAKALEESFSRMLAGTKQGFSMASMTQYATALAPGFTAMGATGNQALSQLVSSLSATKGADTEANTAARLGSFMNAVGRTDIADSYYNAGVDYNASLKSYMKGGYSQYDAAVQISNRFIDSKGSQFQQLWDKASKAGNVDAQQSLMQRYGLQEVFRTPEAVNHAMSMKQNWQSYQANQQRMNSPAAMQTLDLDFARQNDTLTGRWNQMTTSVMNIALNVGEALTPVLVSLSDILIPILDQLVTWTAANPELVRGIVMAVAGFFAFRMALSGAKLGITTLLSPLLSVWDGILQVQRGWQLFNAGLRTTGVLQGVGAALNWLVGGAGTLGRMLGGVLRSGFMMAGRAVLFLGRMLLMNPIGLAVTAFAGAAYLVYRYWEPISAFFKNLWSQVSQAFNAGWEALNNAVSGGVAGIAALLLDWSPFGVLYSIFADTVSELGIQLPGSLSELGGVIIDALVKGLISYFPELKNVLETIDEFIPDSVKNFLGIGSKKVSVEASGQSVAAGVMTPPVLQPTSVSALSLQPTLPVELPKTEDTMPTPQQRVAMSSSVGGAKGKLVTVAPSERVQVAFSPTIYLNGQKAAPTPEMTKTLTLSMNELENMLNKLLAQRERRGYA